MVAEVAGTLTIAGDDPLRRQRLRRGQGSDRRILHVPRIRHLIILLLIHRFAGWRVGYPCRTLEGLIVEGMGASNGA